jgi:transposase
MPVKEQICPACGDVTKRVHDYRIQKLKHLKIWERMTTMFYRRRRYTCKCGKRFSEENPIIGRYQRYSKEWNQMAQVRAVKGKTFKETAEQYGTSVSTIVRRFDRIVSPAMKEPRELPEVIAIDEFKGDTCEGKFQLIIADGVTREPIDILPNRKKETIKNYLRKHGAKVKIVSMDMSYAFKAAVEQALDKPIIVADRFHFVRYMYWAIDRVRIRVQKDWHDYDRKKVKKKRFLFFKKSVDLTEEDRWYLKRYFEFSPELKKAYELKEQFCRWFEEAKEQGKDNLLQTKESLLELYECIQEADIPEFTKASKTFQNWQTEIMNSFAFSYSNGFLEGLNNLTKVIKRNAFGFRSFERMRAKILLTHQYKKVCNSIG